MVGYTEVILLDEVGHTEIGRNGLLGDSAREVDFTCADGIWAYNARM